MKNLGAHLHRPRQNQTKDERGFVLLLVLAGLAFLSFIAAATLADARHGARVAASRAGTVEAALLAEAGLARAEVAIDEAYSKDAWPENGAPVQFAFGGGEIAVSIADEAGKVDLLMAPELMAQAVLGHAGLTPVREAEVLKALQVARTRAALERRQLAPATLEDLATLIGLSRDEMQAIRPFVTVHTGLGGFDPAVASPELIALLPGATSETLSTLAASRCARADAPERPPSPAPAFTSVSPRRVFTVRAEACTASGHLAVREAVYERRAAGHFARIELRDPIEARLLPPLCAKTRVAVATNR